MSVNLTNNRFDQNFIDYISEELEIERASNTLVEMKTATSTENSEVSEESVEEVLISKISLRKQGLAQTKHDKNNHSDFKITNILPFGSQRSCRK